MGRADREKNLKEIFGQAYSEDQDDSTAERIPFDVWLASLKIGGDIANVTHLVGRALAMAPEISCQENQNILGRHLQGLIGEKSPLTADELWASGKHRQTCANSTCQRLSEIVCQDKYLTGEEIGTLYGKEIDKLLRESF